MVWQHDLLHGRYKPEILRGKIENAGKSEMQFFRRAIFSFLYKAKQIVLHFLSRHVFEQNAGKIFFKVPLAHALILLVCTRFYRLLFEFEPLRNIIGKKHVHDICLLRQRL